VRIRLAVLFLSLMAVALVALGLPLGQAIRNSYNREVFLNRLNDTARFAAIAQQADNADQLVAVGTELRRYRSVYGIDCFVLADDGTVRLAASTRLLPRDASAQLHISNALGGRRSDPPAAPWPWSTKPMVVAEPIIRGGDVVGAMVTVSPLDSMRGRLLRAWALLLALVLAALVACFYIANRLAGWLLRPVGILDAAANEVATGRLDARVASEMGPPELRQLAASFNDMADNVQTSLEQQRAFVADASHQLRNPLAALLLRLDDLALRVPTELLSDASQAVDEGRQLVDILERLLELAKAENAGGTTGPCDVVALVEQRLRTWQPIADVRRITLFCQAPAELTTWTDASAASGALDVVIDNALKFSPEGGSVDVRISADADHVTVQVHDSGPGLSPDELSRVGSRFWRSPGQQNAAGFGLGLSIARALLERSGGLLEFSSHVNGGLIAHVVLRREPVSSSDGETNGQRQDAIGRGR
jgi:signal transduction histidine kinase